jgi:glutaredoxin-related protein
MKLTDQEKINILESVLTTISHISDKNYQMRIWIRGEGPEVDDFDETICHFSQDGVGVIEKYRDFGLTENQYRTLSQFRDELKKFSDHNDLPQLFIDSSEWTKITLMAKKVLEVFNYQK